MHDDEMDEENEDEQEDDSDDVEGCNARLPKAAKRIVKDFVARRSRLNS